MTISRSISERDEGMLLRRCVGSQFVNDGTSILRIAIDISHFELV